MADASLVSMLRILPWATSLRRKARCSIPGSLMSSTYVALPWMRRGSSRRLMRSPTSFGRIGRSIVVIALSLLCRVLDGIDDVLVARAAAEVPADALPNLGLAGVGVFAKEVHTRHNHAGRAVAALQAVLLPEPLLQGMQSAFRREPLD